MSAPHLSIVIPTHRRAEILRQCLDAIDRQSARDRLEAIVVSDGRDGKTDALFAKKNWKTPVTYLAIPKSQQGVARNRGVEKARGERVLFIGDDIFLAPDACEKHMMDVRAAVLGHTTWDPALAITPVMRWLETSGWQFGYPLLTPYAHARVPRELQPRVTYTSHLSLPLTTARAVPFREDVTLYGWEDIEWGMRLRDAGVPLVYEPDARALHHHPMTLEDSLKRMETLGTSAIVMEEFVPGFDRVPRGGKLWAYRLASLLPTMAGRHRKAFLRGIAGANDAQKN